jgi:two-component system, OmpR family, sensor histidine kinase VicK
MWTLRIYSNNSEYISMVAFHQLMQQSQADTLSTPGEGSSSLASPTKAEGVTEIIYGTEAVIETVLHAISLIKESLDIFMDITSISIITSNERLMDAYVKLKDRGVKIRNITEITIDSIPYLKKMMSFAEVRHIDGITGSFGVSERDYISNDTSPTDTISQRAIHSTMKVFVQQHQYLFDTIWKNAIPAEQKIQEIEKGIKPIATRLLEDPDEIFNHMKCVIENASKRLLCSSRGAMQMVYDNFFDLYKRILDKHRQGGGKDGIRWITTVDKDNKDLVKAFLNAGVQIRHLRNLPPMNFAVDNKHFHGTIENMEGGKMMRSLLTSNEPIYVNHYNSIFEDLWKNGIDAVQRIREIEDGTSLADLEIFCNQPIPGLSSLTLSQLDNKTAIIEIINRNVKQYTALRICHSYRWNQEYVNFRMECKPE